MFNVFIVANIRHCAVFSLAEPHRGSFCGGLPVLLGNATPVSGGEGGGGAYWTESGLTWVWSRLFLSAAAVSVETFEEEQNRRGVRQRQVSESTSAPQGSVSLWSGRV